MIKDGTTAIEKAKACIALLKAATALLEYGEHADSVGLDEANEATDWLLVSASILLGELQQYRATLRDKGVLNN